VNTTFSRLRMMFLSAIASVSFGLGHASEEQLAEPGGFPEQPASSTVTDTGRAENGEPYLADAAAPGSPARAAWRLGKIEPAVEDARNRGGSVDIILYLGIPERLPAGVERVSEIKSGYQPILDDLATQIRAIVSANRPGTPIDEADERLWARTRSNLDTEQSEKLDFLRRELDATRDLMRRDIQTALRNRAEAKFVEIRDAIRNAGGSINNEVPLTLAMGVTVPSDLVPVLAERNDVLTIMLDRPQELELDVSIPSLQIDAWWSAGFDGGIWDGGVVDTGVQEDHPAFASVNFLTDAAAGTDGDGHGTHVAGIIASGNSTFSGGAPGLDALIWGRSGGQSTTMSSMETMAGDLGQSPEVVNHSLGYGTANVSDYNANDTFYDAYIENYDILVTKSAGNGGWSASAQTITHPAPAYNLLAVANMNDRGTIDRSDDVRRFDSSIGPTVNGRRKPDITAPGTTIRSTNAFWAGAGSGANRSCRDSSVDWDYVDCSGTSMAAPHVAAAIVLMEDGGNNNPISQKAVLLNTADAWTSNDTSGTGDDGPVDGSRWDISYGWGYLDGWESQFNRTDYFLTSIVPRNDNATEDDYKLYVGQMFAGEKATMVWEKRGVYDAGSPASTTYSLADLNLRLYNEETGGLVDSELGGDDNVHQVATDSLITAVIKPYAWSTSFSGSISAEQFALATEEDFVEAVFPDSFQGIVSRPSQVQPNEEFTYRGYVRNDSDLASHANMIEVQLPAGWSIISGPNPQNIGSVPGGGTVAANRAEWTLRAPSTPQLDVAVPFTHAHNSYAESYGPLSWNVTIDVVQDVTPPSPVPAFITSPTPLSSSVMTMTSSTANDEHGPVEYFFDFLSSPSGGSGGSNSGWIVSTSYSDSGLDPNHRYCYRVAARDNPTTTPNVTAYSPTSCAYTFANPPASGSVMLMTSNALRVSWNANGNPAGTEYFVENTTTGDSSGWISATTWDNVGLSAGTHEYQGKARNGLGIETGWIVLGNQDIDADMMFLDGFETVGVP